MKKALFAVVALLLGVFFSVVSNKPRMVQSGAPEVTNAGAPDHVANLPMHRKQVKLLTQTQPLVLERGPQIQRTLPAGPRPVSNLPPVIEWTGPWPTSLDDVPVTPWMEKRTSHWDAQERELADQKLKILPEIDKCLGGRAKSVGNVEVIFHFKVDPKTSTALGDQVDMIASTLSEEDDALFLECAQKVVFNTVIKIADVAAMEEDDHWHWPEAIHLPTKHDWIYPGLLKQ